MALITCADCGRQISDAAPSCIHCGRPRAANLAAAGQAAPAPGAEPWSASSQGAPPPSARPYPAHWDAPAEVPRRPQAFGDHWWRGKIYVVLSYLGGVFLLLMGLAGFADPETGPGLAVVMLALGALSFWLGYAVSEFRKSGYWVAMVLLVLAIFGAVTEALTAGDTVGMEGATASLLLYVIFASYFYERRADFVN